jgi:tetratricopeptide (TPR) repeat protein
MRRRWCGASLVSIMVVAAVPTVHADEVADQKAAAREKLKAGRTNFDLGKFDEAIVLFEESYKAYPYPETLYNLAQAWRQKGDLKRAVFHYKAYLRYKPEAENRAEVETRIVEMEKTLKEQDASSKKPPNDVTIPGEGKVVTEPKVEVPPPPPPQPTMIPAPPWYADTLGWVGVGAGLVVLGVGAYELGAASDTRDDARLADELSRPGLLADADDQELLGTIGLVAGGAILTAGIVKLAWTDAPREAQVIVGAAWVGVAGTF